MLIAGVDIIEISRVRRVYERYGDRFLRRIYTEREAAYCRGRAPQLASRFAAKEATMKALGTGVRGVRWRDIEVVRGRGQAPRIVLHGTARARADRDWNVRHRSLPEPFQRIRRGLGNWRERKGKYTVEEIICCLYPY